MLTPIVQMLFAVSAITGLPAYDLHTRALVPVRENVRPSCRPLELVRDGECRFAIAWNEGCEKNCGKYRRTSASVTPALAILTEAFERTFGRAPDVIDAKDARAVARYPFVLALGPSPVTRKFGFDTAKEPDQGFTVATVGNVLVIHGNDSSQIPGYNGPWERKESSRGTYFGALDFVERFLGVRYFFPGEFGTLWRPAKDLVVNPVSYTDRPHFRFRGSRYHFNATFLDAKLIEKWKSLLGERAVKRGDGSFVARWRDGGAGAIAGSHAPDPQKFGNRHSNVVDRCFFNDPYGYVAFYPNQHYPNLYDVTNLETIDHFINDIKAQFAQTEPPWDKAGWSGLSKTYIPWGQCDTAMSLMEIAFDKEVRELGLVDPKDIERARQPDGVLRNESGCFANVWGRFVQAYANRVRKEFPGEKLYALVYSNGKFPPNDPRWKLPDNVEISFTDQRLPYRLLNPGDRRDILRIAREWSDAIGGRPLARVWLYTDNEKGSRFTRAINPELVGLVPKAFGEMLGNDWCYFDCNGVDDLWHFYFAHYACFHLQWNPDFDVDAALDEHWEPFYGEKAGRKLREFHAVLKKAVLESFARDDLWTDDEKFSAQVSGETVDRLEKLLSEARASVEKGSDAEKRLNLFAYPWPDAFAKRRDELAHPKLTEAERRIWKRGDIRIDSWDGVYARFEMNPNPYKTNRSALQMDLANPLTRYTFSITASWPTEKAGLQQHLSVQQGRKRYGFTWADSVAIAVNGQTHRDLEILPTDVVPWAQGEARGYEIKLNFRDAPCVLRVSLKPGSYNLRFELVPDDKAKVSSAKVSVSAVPSFFEVPNGKTRFDGYRREIVTAKRTLRGEKGAKPVDLDAEDGYVVFRDADYDGSGDGKGVGPCAVIADFGVARRIRAGVSDSCRSDVAFELKPDFRAFRFALYQDLDRPCANSAFHLRK